MKKKFYKIKIFLIVFILILILTTIFFFTGKKLVNNLILKNNQSEINNLDYTAPEDNINKDIENINRTESEKKEENSGSSNIDNLNSDICEKRQISYSLLILNKTVICNKYESEVCIDKTVICSAEIQNRDQEISGNFKIKLSFVLGDIYNEESELNQSSYDLLLNPMEKKEIIESTRIISLGENGNANKNINCFYNILNISKKTVC